MTTPDLPPLREIIARNDLQARKSLGQNFLLDLNLTGRIARAAGGLEGTTVIEVGPGPGGLTRSLLEHGAERVIAVERDDRCRRALDYLADAYPERLTIVAGDALEIDLGAFARGSTKIVANLPYNVATALLVYWLKVEPWPPWWSSATLMFQKEVAQRLTASPGSKAYGRLSVLAQWRCRVEQLFDIDRRAFTPPPKVTSTLVQLVPGPPVLAACRVDALERVTAAAFGQRRKMLRSSLKSLGADTEKLISDAGLAATARAEEIDIAGFCRLASAAGRNRPDSAA